jgi:hypothetical protein
VGEKSSNTEEEKKRAKIKEQDRARNKANKGWDRQFSALHIEKMQATHEKCNIELKNQFSVNKELATVFLEILKKWGGVKIKEQQHVSI